MNIQFLIVGQGLAGSLLAWELMNRNQSVSIVDYPIPTAASRIAAGLINPVTGQRLVKAPEVDTCLAVALDYYQRLTERFGQTYYHANPMLRLFRSAADVDRYKTRRKDPEYQNYLGDAFAAGQSGQPVNDPMGGFHQTQTGYLAVTPLLTSLRDYFVAQGIYRSSNLDYAQLRFDAGKIHWKDIVADCVIFCEGAEVLNNPWFRWLPFQLSKGDIISLQSARELPSAIINDGYWLLPIDKHHALVGATYQWQWSDDADSATATRTLVAAFERMTGITKDVTITDQRAGIRPTTRDKQPFIGVHPDKPYLGIFNGFGSRGAMSIPCYCQRFADYLLSNKPLPDNVNIARFEDQPSMVTLAKRYLSEKLYQGDVAIDATTGNGYDTEFLARCVGPQGRVYGFDIQRAAVERTAQRLQASGLYDRVTLFSASHEHMSQQVPREHHQNVNAIVFNLGYLPGHNPGSGKKIATEEHSTRAALNEALQLLQRDGLLCVVIYPGHPGGAEELAAVMHWARQLDSQQYKSQWPGKNTHNGKRDPLLLVIEKRVATTTIHTV
ncbi:MAG: FAD-dependent oxidoreductase [Gammaproteobacteria bacterium]|jgi:glycine/D-amino acid oxidase-like deaminating enzyme